MHREDINYIKRDNRSTIVAYESYIETVDKTILDVLDTLCLDNLSTLKGRIAAVKKVFQIKKFVPIYVSDNLLLQPVNDIKAWNLTYINPYQVAEIKSINEKTEITFFSGEKLLIDLPTKKACLFLEKSIKIKKKITITY